MKCLILAGGHGERLWPLSRRNYPKQFIQIRKNHSMFQETVARNIPYCDEFIIVTNWSYRYIIENQMAAFQGITYRCVYEEAPRKTAAAVTLACLELQPSELVFVVASDQLIQTEAEKGALNYQEAVLEARREAANGQIVLFGIPSKKPNPRFGWIMHKEKSVLQFIEKPYEEELEPKPVYLQNAGMMVFENGIFQQTVRKTQPDYFTACRKAHSSRRVSGNTIFYAKEFMDQIFPMSVEALVLQENPKAAVITCGFNWADVGKLEELSEADYKGEGLCVKEKSQDSVVINNSPDKIVVLNEADHLMVVNTSDAVYIGRYGASANLKKVFADHPELKPYAEHGAVNYRSWGYYHQLFETDGYRVRRVILYPGKTIYSHSHLSRTENLTIIQGKVNLSLNGRQTELQEASTVSILPGVVHQISNIGMAEVIAIETAFGNLVHEESDMVSQPTENLGEKQLGLEIESVIKLSPAFKDYLWGGTKLREIYKKKCDYEIIAESWELSAHSAGQSIVASGRHKGMPFNAYLDTVGKEILGWKCQSMTDFPILIKFIDAKQKLSVQVHPDDDYALEHEHEYGKSEMWYVMDAEPGAGLYIGFNRQTSREEVESRVKNHTLDEILNFLPTHPGDVFFIPAGTVHAIGAGNLICEVQQSSNSTYRLYDYNRKDKYGNQRELHLEKALDVLNYQRYEVSAIKEEPEADIKTWNQCKYFEVSACAVTDRYVIHGTEICFTAVVCIKGEGIIRDEKASEKIKAGDCFFIRAGNMDIELLGNLKVLLVKV